MICPDCSWTAVHVHHDSAPALTSSADVVERTVARRQEHPLLAAGTNTLLDGIIDRLINGDPVTVWHLSPPAEPASPG